MDIALFIGWVTSFEPLSLRVAIAVTVIEYKLLSGLLSPVAKNIVAALTTTPLVPSFRAPAANTQWRSYVYS